MSDLWFEAFRQDSQKAVADLFNGRAGVGSSLRLDVPELLRLWFPPNLAEERAQLDDALLAWLLEMRESYALQVERLGFPVYGKRVGDALIALQLLDLPQARDEIRKNMDAWLRWLSPLRLAPERDPALECLRLLTQGQPDTRHAATWLRLAVDRRAEYLTVALAGLQRLSNGGDARKNQVLMLQALLHHTATIFHEVNGALKFFNRRFGALRGLYPRGPQHWQAVLEEALSKFLRQSPPRFAKDLAHELRQRQSAKRRNTLPRRRKPAPKQEWQALQSDISNPSKQPEELARRLLKILERNDNYASETGDSHPFVTTLCNLGGEMLERHALNTSDRDRLGTVIERALVWEAANPYCWMLWAQWFQAQGQRGAQEAVLREMLRMFPHDPPPHVELARLLIRRGKENWQEAEHFLRRAMKQAPNDGHSHVVMARLLRLRGELDAAKQTLKGFLANNPDNLEARDSLEKLQAGLTSYSTHPGDDPRSAAQEGEPCQRAHAAPASGLDEILRRGGLAEEFNRARIANGNAVQTTRIRQESRLGDSLAGFYSQWLRLDDTPECPPYAWAWDACLHWQRAAAPEHWQDLAKRFPEAAAETDFLRSLICPDSPDLAGWRERYRTEDGTRSRPVDVLMREMSKMWEQLAAIHNANQHERDEAACAVMACAAANVPEFTVSLD